jgi:hypothetical protein
MAPFEQIKDGVPFTPAEHELIQHAGAWGGEPLTRAIQTIYLARSNTKLAEANEKQTRAMVRLTWVLVFVGIAQIIATIVATIVGGLIGR